MELTRLKEVINTEWDGNYIKGVGARVCFWFNDMRELKEFQNLILKNQVDATQFEAFVDALALEVQLEDIDWIKGDVDFTKFCKHIRISFEKEQRLDSEIHKLEDLLHPELNTKLPVLKSIRDGND